MSATIDQIRCFIAAAEEDSFFNAALREHTTQSTLSKQIMKLEEELQVKLLDRSRRKASLTPEGKQFYEHGKKILKDYEEALQSLHQDQPEDLRIGTLPFQVQYGLGSQLHRFRKLHPEFHVHVRELEEQDLLNEFEEGHLDLIIIRSSMCTAKMKTFRITEDELVAAASVEHPLFAHRRITLKDVSQYPLYLMNPYTAVYQLCRKEFRNANINPEITGTGRPETLLNTIAMGDSVCLLPRSNLNVFHPEGVCCTSLDPQIILPVVLAVLADHRIRSCEEKLIRFITLPEQKTEA